MNNNIKDTDLLDNELDIKLDKPKSSRFLFVLGFFGIFIFAWSGCYNLYQHKYFSHIENKIEVNPSSKLDPEYK